MRCEHDAATRQNPTNADQPMASLLCGKLDIFLG